MNNILIAEAFYLTSDIEKQESGFIRIRKAIADYPTMKFEYKNLGHGFLTQFSYTKQKVSSFNDDLNEKLGEKLGEKKSLILKSIKANNKITIIELSKIVGVSETSVQNNLSKLKESGILKRVGPAKGGYWVILSHVDLV